MIRQLKIKFVCINMLIVTSMLAAILGMVLQNTYRDMEELTFHSMERVHTYVSGRSPSRGERVASFFIFYQLPDGKQDVVSHGMFEDCTREELLEIGRNVNESGQQRGVLKEQNLRFLRRMIHKGESITFVDISVERSIMSGLIRNSIRIFIAAFALFLGLSVLLAQWAVRPVERVWKTQQQFVADASHELKTPLTVIMTNAEILQDRNPDPQAGQFLQNILSMSQQMRGLVEGLLNLARVDNGIVKNTFSDVDLTNLVNLSLLPFEPVFYEKEMELQTDLEPQLHVRGSASHLRQAVEILLDNAVKYGAEGQPVQLSLHHQGKYVQLCVRTAGQEISRQDLKNIFERFYRIDKARSMNQSYGLGLSIAQRIVSDHNGRIWAESGSGSNSFFIQIPYFIAPTECT